nr:MAG TPA: secretion system protein [Caudoviricetes sp.]
MARSLTEIYNEAKETRDKYLESTEVTNDSKMSILNAITWTTSACIWVFENIMDTFKVDMARELQYRVNGTPAYYASALLKYQSGDKLVINDEGTQFSYANIDETKRVVTKVSYSEYQSDGFYDKILLLKVATGEAGGFTRIDDNEMLAVRSYIDQIKFAGTSVNVVSRNGDVLIPKVTVYYDGAISKDEVYTNIENSLNNFIANIEFDGNIYVQKVIDAIQQAEHVTDVYIDNSSDFQGIFVAQYNDDNLLIPTEQDEEGNVTSYEKKIDRMFVPNSGFIKQSSKEGLEESLQTWRESIILKIETE